MTPLIELLQTRKALLIDGAMGTELFARGLTAGDPPEMWNVDSPELVTDVHEGYLMAGSDIILTNSFGGSSFRLKLHKLQDRAIELNAAAATAARRAADQLDRPVVVAGSMGPSGELMQPMGELTMDSAAAAFADQAKGLAEGGADILWIETMSSLDEVEAAVNGIRQVTDLPISATLSFDTAGRTMMGVTGADAAERLVNLGLNALGANCGNNIAETERAIEEVVAGAGDVPVVVKANAGIPEFKGDELSYNGSPAIMGAHAQRMMNLGVKIIGGCCGTSTGHIAYMRKVIDGDIVAPDIAAPGPSRPDDADVAPRRERTRRRRSG